MTTWTPIHAALGEPLSPLTWEHITRAVDQKLPEAEDLDWKGALPGKAPSVGEEVGKDIAAMANTRGGLIVYGIEEERGRGTADKISPVDISESARRRLRALAASNIHPFVSGIEITALQADDSNDIGVLVLSVPISPDAPHVVGAQDKLSVPFRDGPETRYMREHDLERSYQDRFNRRVDEQTHLRDAIKDITERLDLEQGLWIAGVARPRTPLPRVVADRAAQAVTDLLHKSLIRADQLVPVSPFGREQVLRQLDNGALNPRVGLRRWICSPPTGWAADELSKYVHVEIHHDGTISFACALESWYESVVENAYQLPTRLVESFCVDFVALLEAIATTHGDRGRYAVEIDLVRADSTRPIAAIDNARHDGWVGGLEVVQGSRHVRRFHPIQSEINASADDDALRSDARTAARDVLSQFGVARLSVVPFTSQTANLPTPATS